MLKIFIVSRPRSGLTAAVPAYVALCITQHSSAGNFFATQLPLQPYLHRHRQNQTHPQMPPENAETKATHWFPYPDQMPPPASSVMEQIGRSTSTSRRSCCIVEKTPTLRYTNRQFCCSTNFSVISSVFAYRQERYCESSANEPVSRFFASAPNKSCIILIFTRN